MQWPAKQLKHLHPRERAAAIAVKSVDESIERTGACNQHECDYGKRRNEGDTGGA